MKVIGQLEYQGAVFVYKADGTEAEAWQCVQAIHKDHGGIRGELHCDKADFLAGLRAWNEATDPANGFLCIHAHMGAPGVNCISGNLPTRVTWLELQAALPRGVELVWLAGCKSQECLSAWQPLTGPVRHLLLATSATKPWRPLLRCFAAEINIKHIRYYDEMPDFLAQVEPELAQFTGYFRPSSSGFVKAF